MKLAAGGWLGSYQLVAPLGAGASATVWRARDGRGAEVALKLLALGEQPELANRFVREAELLAQVDRHPNVLRVHSAGQAGPYLYLACELAAGGTLSDRLREGPLEPAAARELVRALAAGLAHVHAAGIVHRDLKPDNVLFTERGPALADFGLARPLDRSSLTATGAVIGTPAFMSPEQAQGRPADERSDVYALGAVLYACLTGQPPHQAPSLLALLNEITNADPTPPRRLRPEVPRDLEQACLRALRRDPAGRYASAEELHEALAEQREPGARAPLVAGVGLACALGVALAGAALWKGRGAAAVSATPPPSPSQQTPSPPPQRARSGVLDEARGLVRDPPAPGSRRADALLRARGRPLLTLDPGRWVFGAHFRGPNRLLTWGADLFEWDLGGPGGGPRRPRRVAEANALVSHVVPGPGPGPTLLVFAEGSGRTWTLEGDRLELLGPETPDAQPPAWSASGERVYLPAGTRLRVFDVARRTILEEHDYAPARVRRAAESADGRYRVLVLERNEGGGRRDELVVLDAAGAARSRQWAGAQVEAVQALGPARFLLAVGHNVVVLDAARGSSLRYEGDDVAGIGHSHQRSVSSLARAPARGFTLSTSGSGGALPARGDMRVWDAQGRQLHTYRIAASAEAYPSAVCLDPEELVFALVWTRERADKREPVSSYVELRLADFR